MAMVGQAVEQGCCHSFSLKDLIPFAKGQVTGDQQTASFIPIGKHLEQQFRSRAAE